MPTDPTQYPIVPTTPPTPTTSTPQTTAPSDYGTATPNSYQTFAKGGSSSTSSSATPSSSSSSQGGGVSDPDAMWQKWLSGGGVQATPQEVQMFLSTLIKFIAQSVLGQATKQAHQSALRMRAVIEGKDPTDI